MRMFINVTTDDFWTALRDDKIIRDSHKPKPYKNHRELTPEEICITICKEQTLILLYSSSRSAEVSKNLITQSMANFICEDYQDLATKHGLTIDRTHEYWRNK